MDFDQTQKITPIEALTNTEQVLIEAHQALLEKNYNSINQLVGYLQSGEPTYITSHNNARAKLSRIERDEILEFLLRRFLEGRHT